MLGSALDGLQTLESLNAEARGWDSGSIKEVERLLASATQQTGLSRLTSIGAVVGADLPKIAGFLEASSQWVEAGIRTAETSGGTIADVDAQIDQTIKTWFEILKETDS